MARALPNFFWSDHLTAATPRALVQIQLEKPNNIPAIHDLLLQSFPTDSEAFLVDRLRKNASPYLSLVAEQDHQLIGHLFFSPAHLPKHPSIKVMGLAPLAVEDEFQDLGIGTALVKAGLAMCRDQGIQAVVVLGHASYYPRFGFAPAVNFGMFCKYPVPSETFMVIELVKNALPKNPGMIHYHPEFDKMDDA